MSLWPLHTLALALSFNHLGDAAAQGLSALRDSPGLRHLLLDVEGSHLGNGRHPP